MPNGHAIYQGALEVFLGGIQLGRLSHLDLYDLEARLVRLPDGRSVRFHGAARSVGQADRLDKRRI